MQSDGLNRFTSHKYQTGFHLYICAEGNSCCCSALSVIEMSDEFEDVVASIDLQITQVSVRHFMYGLSWQLTMSNVSGDLASYSRYIAKLKVFTVRGHASSQLPRTTTVHEARPASSLWDGLCGGDKRWREEGGRGRRWGGRDSKAVRTLPVWEVGKTPKVVAEHEVGVDSVTRRQEHRCVIGRRLSLMGWN
jgi:hypothetical protein